MKVGALVNCFDWFDSYFAGCLSKKNSDSKQIEDVRNECQSHFKDVFRDYVKKDIACSPGRLWHWLNNRDLCRLSVADVCYQGLKGVVLRITGKI